MSTEAVHLGFLLDAPMQSWASASRFQRRGTNHHPTKSGLAGMIAAALGLAKGSEREREILARLAALRLSTFALPRVQQRTGKLLTTQRLRDYHTVGGGYHKATHPLNIPRKAKGGPGDNATVTEREYLTEVRFAVLFSGESSDRELLAEIGRALRDPVWGIWFGRKACLPAAPLEPLVEADREVILTQLLQRANLSGHSIDEFESEQEQRDFTQADAVFDDQPVSFGTGRSSGSEGRVYRARAVNLLRGKSPAKPTGREAKGSVSHSPDCFDPLTDEELKDWGL